MWLVWFDKKRDVDVFVYDELLFTSNKAGLGKSARILLTKRKT